MSIKKINKLFRIVIICIGIIGITFLFFVAPLASHSIHLNTHQLIIQIFFWVSAIPVFGILFSLWKISTELKKEHYFSEIIQKKLTYITRAGIAECVIYSIAILFGLFFIKNNPSYFVFTGLFFLIGIIIAIFATLLLHIIKHADELKNEHDLTI